MAGALVGGALLSGFINVVFDRFITTDAVNLVLGKKLGPDLVERLKISLLAAEALVGDAEYKQLDNPSVREWLNSLRDAVYVADDLLDAVLTKAATRKEVRSFWPVSFLDRDRKIVDKMEGVVRRIEFLVKQKDLLGLEKTLFLAGDFYGRFEELGDAVNVYTRTRHLSYESSNLVSKNFNSISKVESLRTFLSIDEFSESDNIDDVTCTPILKLKYLRVLSLPWFKGLNVLPESIGELTYLRYLDLSRTCIRTLPESLCDLYNLQTLKLECCSSLTMLPNGMHKLVNLQHLNILDTHLEEMPRGMSKLQHLHILSNFIVGKHKDNGIQELELLNLHGSFEIQKLENVLDVKEARSARIIDKKHIDHLLLEWSSGDYMVSSTQTERDILDSLQPHHCLEVLQIKGYKGTIFPDWMGHCSYQNMTHVSLESCKNCCMLPSLGQLPSLKSLCIQDFHQLRSIGMEFYKNEGDHHSSHIAPFPSLEFLEFNNMPCWEVWHLPDSETFPRLMELQIRDCPVLKGDMLGRVFLRIISSLWDVSKVCKLDIRTDYGGESEMSLREDMVSIQGCESMLEFVLQALFRDNCVLKSLQTLTIWRCRKLKFPQQQQKYSLVELYIEQSCDSLTSLSLDDFPNLKTLTISECKNLKSVSLSEPSHAALQRLTIFKCSKFVSFTGKGLAAPNLTHLEVSFCTKLEALPRDMNTLLPSLQSLEIEGCWEFCRLPKVGLLPNLKQLVIGKQWRGLWSMRKLDTLTHLIIYGFGSENVKSFPEAGSLPHLPSLTTLKISGFSNLETLECNQLLCLTSLQQLHIQWCNKLKNMAGEKLPSSLLLLQIDSCRLLGEHCKNKHQQIWPKISHIPSIQVGTQEVFLRRTDPSSLRGINNPEFVRGSKLELYVRNQKRWFLFLAAGSLQQQSTNLTIGIYLSGHKQLSK
ncbi:hypothetical protein Ahy_B02g057379 [Arachis hypogaea]|uniref:Uncharacterized protein n=1 Tax=Arachis hypogaea TaxID=3818 RepID=A0A445ABP9_ARAHY|nr:hypothetical protein Ahy_B02g057379 [Arachis hypogaea]